MQPSKWLNVQHLNSCGFDFEGFVIGIGVFDGIHEGVSLRLICFTLLTMWNCSRFNQFIANNVNIVMKLSSRR